MICTGACCRRRSLHDIQAAHLLLAFRDTPPRSKVASVSERSRLARKKISIERENAIGLAEVVDGVDILTKGHDRAGARVVTIDGLVLMPLGLRKLGKDSVHLRGQRR